MVHRKRDFRDMEIVRFTSMDSWKTYVSLLDPHSHVQVMESDNLEVTAGSGKSVLSCVNLHVFSFGRT